MKSSKNKIRRYRNLVKHVANWPAYLLFKIIDGQKYFNFQLRDSFAVEVDRKILPSFKESFFDNIYLQALPADMLQKSYPLIVDIGANAGFFSLNMFYHFPNAKVYAYEPVPFNFEILKKYQRTFPDFDFHIFQEAVGGEDTRLKLSLSTLEGYTTMASVFENDSRGYQIEVPAHRLETVFRTQQLTHVDLLKLDCEGAEYQILYQSSDAVLDQISCMSIETHQGSKPEENLPALRSFLGQKGFITVALEEGKYGYLWAWKN